MTDIVSAKSKARKENNMTTNEMLAKVIANEIDDEVVAKATEMLEKAKDRNEKRKGKPSKTTLENAPLYDKIMEILGNADIPMKADEIAVALGDDIKTQKVTGLMTTLVKNGKVSKALESGVAKSKAKTVYSVVAE